MSQAGAGDANATGGAALEETRAWARADALEEFCEVFAERQFYEAHEVLEDAWLDEPRESPERRAMQGLIHLAAGYLLWLRGKPGGAATRLASGWAHLAAAPPEAVLGVQVGGEALDLSGARELVAAPYRDSAVPEVRVASGQPSR